MKSSSLSLEKNCGLVLATTGVILTTALSCYMLGYKNGQRSKTKSTWSNKSYEAKSPSSFNNSNYNNDQTGMDIAEEPLRILRKAETALQKRTSKLIIVIERCTSDHNYSAILRTAEALGIQHVWLIDPIIKVQQLQSSDTTTNAEILVKEKLDRKTKSRITNDEIQMKGKHHLFAQNATEWLSIREFKCTKDCIDALRESGYDIWVTDLSQDAVAITPDTLPKTIPDDTKIALVFGTEAVGASNEILQAADLRIYLPLYGYADSLNLSVATALILQALYHLYPNEVIGNMPNEERCELRKEWYVKLASQRLYTSSEKKTRIKLKNQLARIEELEIKLKNNQSLEPEQMNKIYQKDDIMQKLNTMETNMKEKALKAVQDSINNPPKPFSDMRRADEHRNCYVGKKTKQRYSDAWKDMPATKNYGTDGKILNSVFIIDSSTKTTGED